MNDKMANDEKAQNAAQSKSSWKDIYTQKMITYKGATLPELFLQYANQVRDMKIRSDDIWLSSFPRTGSHWSQEMVWCIANDVDLEAAKINRLFDRFPNCDASLFRFARDIEDSCPNYIKRNSYEYAANLPSQRFIKTHLPFQLLPEELQQNNAKAKIIYVVRNPRDICVSMFHLMVSLRIYTGDFDTYCEAFLGGGEIYGPFWDHVIKYWEQRQNLNILILKYEDMKKDLKSVIYKVAEYLGKTLDEGQVAKLLDHLSFEKMRKNPAVNLEDYDRLLKKHNLLPEKSEPFIRSGKVGGWREAMNANQVERFEKWEMENLKKADKSLIKFFSLDYLE